MSDEKPPRENPANQTLGCLVLLALGLAAGYVAAQPLVRLGWPPVVAYLAGFCAAVAFLFVLLFTLTPQGRSNLRLIVRTFAFPDWLAVRRASPAMRKLEPKPPFTIWTDCGDELPFDPADVADRVGREFSELTGLELPDTRPIRLTVFNNWAGFEQYSRSILMALELTGVYLHLRRRSRMTICLEAARAQTPLGEIGVFEALAAYHLLHRHYRKPQEPWLQAGISGVLERPRLVSNAPGAFARYHVAERARETVLTAEELLTANRNPLGPAFQQLTPAQRSAQFTRVSHLSELLVSGLLARCGPRFTAFLQSRRSTKLSPRQFEREFGLSAADILDEASDELSNAQPPDYVAPPIAARQLIDDRLLPMLNDESVPLPLRRMAVNNLGLLGYPWRAKELVRIADDDFEELQPNALYAVENIAGRSFRPDRWRILGWLKELPADVVADD